VGHCDSYLFDWVVFKHIPCKLFVDLVVVCVWPGARMCVCGWTEGEVGT
jgi:hypothetical protein